VRALLGFLYWNRPPARPFMGDCGSLFIGAAIAGASLCTGAKETPRSVDVGRHRDHPRRELSTPPSCWCFAAWPAGAPRARHRSVSHRLVSLGFSERSAVASLLPCGHRGGDGLGASSGRRREMIPAGRALAVVVFGRHLSRPRARLQPQDFKALRQSPFAPLLKDLTFRWHAAEVMLDSC